MVQKQTCRLREQDRYAATAVELWTKPEILQKIQSPPGEECWESWRSTCRRQKLDPYLSPVQKISSKSVKDKRSETLNLLEETGEAITQAKTS